MSIDGTVTSEAIANDWQTEEIKCVAMNAAGQKRIWSGYQCFLMFSIRCEESFRGHWFLYLCWSHCESQTAEERTGLSICWLVRERGCK